jgi:hypothetical protein
VKGYFISDLLVCQVFLRFFLFFWTKMSTIHECLIGFGQGVRFARDSLDISQKYFSGLPGDLDFGKETQKIIKGLYVPSVFEPIVSQRQGKKFPPVPLHSNVFQYNEDDKNHDQNKANRRKV